MNNVEKRRRPPSLYALIGVIALMTLGVGLFVLGPVNPNITVAGAERPTKHGAGVRTDALLGTGGSFGSGQSVDSRGRLVLDLEVTNHSLLPVDVLGVRTESIGRAFATPPVAESVGGLPASLGRGGTATASITLDARTACTPQRRNDAAFQVVFRVRTAAGIDREVPEPGSRWVSCDADTLPTPGPGPDAPDAARGDVARAFGVAYDFAASPTARRASIDDASGLDPVVEDVMSGPYAAIAARIAPRIVEIVFTSPSSAAVLYDLGGETGSIGAGRVGEARLVDGRWKVTRATVCADLALAQVDCADD